MQLGRPTQGIVHKIYPIGIHIIFLAAQPREVRVKPVKVHRRKGLEGRSGQVARVNWVGGVHGCIGADVREVVLESWFGYERGVGCAE